MTPPTIALFRGGVSREREVSLGSGAAALASLSRRYAVRDFVLESAALPPGFDPRSMVVFSTLHGTFGEDGQIQRLLEAAGASYAGCDAAASALTFDKQRTKEAVAAAGVVTVPGLYFHTDAPPSVDALIGAASDDVVLKPRAEGSSVGLQFAAGREAIATALGSLAPGSWLCERRIAGREITVGLLDGKAQAVVEIRPQSGRFDYTSKYTKGLTEYLCPAPLPEEVALLVRTAAERAFSACGCRDFARIDFMLDGALRPWFLEINTLPGLKETSLLPMSARAFGRDFDALVDTMLAPALSRFANARS